jgi:hypothetical protein
MNQRLQALPFTLGQLLKGVCTLNELALLIRLAKEACIREHDFTNAAELRDVQKATLKESNAHQVKLFNQMITRIDRKLDHAATPVRKANAKLKHKAKP